MTQLPDHLFVSSEDGALYDLREADWSTRPPLRRVYGQHGGTIENAHQLKAALRGGPWVWPGGYPRYFYMADGAPLLFETARKELRLLLAAFKDNDEQWRVAGTDVNWEDPALVCCHTGERIPWAYGDDPVASTDEDATAP